MLNEKEMAFLKAYSAFLDAVKELDGITVVNHNTLRSTEANAEKRELLAERMNVIARMKGMEKKGA